MRNSLIFCTVFAFLLVFSAGDVFACSCVAPDPNKSLEQNVREAYKNSTGIFTAKVLLVTENSATGNKTIKLRLGKSWKGKFSRTFNITTGMGGGDCGYFFEIGETYLVYAYRDDDKNFTTNICTRTAATSLNKDIAVLNRLRKRY